MNSKDRIKVAVGALVLSTAVWFTAKQVYEVKPPATKYSEPPQPGRSLPALPEAPPAAHPNRMELKEDLPIYESVDGEKPKATFPRGSTVNIMSSVKGGYVIHGHVNGELQMGIAKEADLKR
jgi:hypothetical protein